MVRVRGSTTLLDERELGMELVILDGRHAHVGHETTVTDFLFGYCGAFSYVR